MGVDRCHFACMAAGRKQAADRNRLRLTPISLSRYLDVAFVLLSLLLIALGQERSRQIRDLDNATEPIKQNHQHLLNPLQFPVEDYLFFLLLVFTFGSQHHSRVAPQPSSFPLSPPKYAPKSL